MRRNCGQDQAMNRVPKQNPTSVFNAVISILERNLKYLKSVELDPTVAKAYRQTIVYLKSRSEEEISNLLKIPKQKTQQTMKETDPELSDGEIMNLTGEQIKGLVSSTAVSRKFLERLASKRFGVSTGALSALRNRSALVDKLNTLVGHEGTHDAIARAIGAGESSPTPAPSTSEKGS